MNRNTVIGILLVVIGVLLLAGVGARDEVVFGPIRMTVENQDRAGWRQLGGVVALAGGIAVLVWDARGGRRRRR